MILFHRLGACLSPRVKKEVSFDNRLCNAYLAAGKAAEFITLLEAEVDSPNADIQVQKTMFLNRKKKVFFRRLEEKFRMAQPLLY